MMHKPLTSWIAAISLSLLVACPSAALAYSPQPDLTAAGAIAALKADPDLQRLSDRGPVQ